MKFLMCHILHIALPPYPSVYYFVMKHFSLAAYWLLVAMLLWASYCQLILEKGIYKDEK